MEEDLLSNQVIGLAIEVHRALGPGLLELAYEACLCYELSNAELNFKRQTPVGVRYKDVHLDCGFRTDIIVDEKLLLELKSTERITALHEAQLLTYLKLTGLSKGLILNFNSVLLKNGIKRKVMTSKNLSDL